MPTEIWVALLTLGGVVIGVLARPAQDWFQSRWQSTREREDRRWRLEYVSLRELDDLLPSFIGMQDPDLETRKVRAAALAWRVRDRRASTIVEKLISEPVGGSSWNDEIGNAIRIVGQAIQDL